MCGMVSPDCDIHDTYSEIIQQHLPYNVVESASVDGHYTLMADEKGATITHTPTWWRMHIPTPTSCEGRATPIEVNLWTEFVQCGRFTTKCSSHPDGFPGPDSAVIDVNSPVAALRRFFPLLLLELQRLDVCE